MANKTIDPATMTFGCEFEVYLPYAAAAAIGNINYHHPVQVPDLPDGWMAKTDSSLDTPPAGMTGVEIMSPILRGEDGLRQVMTACVWFRAKGAKVNHTCGFHVHVGFSPERMDALGRLVCLTAQHEEALYAATGSRRRRGARWCQSIKDSWRAEKLRRKFKEGRRDESLPTNHSERYVTLNVTNLAAGIRDAVEFRVFAGTTSALKAIGYIRICLGLVEKAMAAGRSPKWERQNKARLARGEGLNAVKHMLVNLGWIGTYVKTPLGNVAGDGLPGLAECTAEVVRLATKYDIGTED